MGFKIGCFKRPLQEAKLQDHLLQDHLEIVLEGNQQVYGGTFKAEVAVIKKEFNNDRSSLEITNLICLCEKYFCQKGHDAKSDQFNFWAWMRREFEEDGTPNPLRDNILMHLERACSGARQDLATNSCLPILINLRFYVDFVLDRKRNKIKAVNRFVHALVKFMSSVEMRSYVRLMTIYDVVVFDCTDSWRVRHTNCTLIRMGRTAWMDRMEPHHCPA